MWLRGTGWPGRDGKRRSGTERKATARSGAVDEDTSTIDLILTSTTNVAVLESGLNQALGDIDSMAVVFLTQAVVGCPTA